MRIAIPYENGEIFPRFGKTASFKLYNLEGGEIVSSVVIPSFGGGHDALASLLKSANADVVICGGIGAEAQQALAGLGIAIYPGFGGQADDAARAFASGALQRGAGHDCAACAENCGESGCAYHSHGEDGCPHHHG